MWQRVELLVGIQWLAGVGQEPHLLVKTRAETFLLHRVGVETTESHCGDLPVQRRLAGLVGVKSESIEESGGPALGSEAGWGLGVAIIALISSWW